MWNTARGNPGLSFCIIARNEERCLDRCLDAIAPIADEIVVVDTGSDDGTVRIARARGVRFGRFAWCDDFAAARNESLRLATRDWVFAIDADEWLEPDAYPLVRRIVAGSPPDVCYAPALVNGTAFDPAGSPRLFRREGAEWVGRLHEQLRPYFEGASRLCRAPEIRLLHDGYHAADVDRAAKAARNARILQAWLAERPDDPLAHYAAYEEIVDRRPGGSEVRAFMDAYATFGEGWLARGVVFARRPLAEYLAYLRTTNEGERTDRFESLYARASAPRS